MAAELCDEKIGKEYICKRAQGYKHITDLTAKALGTSGDINQNYINLLKRCGSVVDGEAGPRGPRSAGNLALYR